MVRYCQNMDLPPTDWVNLSMTYLCPLIGSWAPLIGYPLAGDTDLVELSRNSHSTDHCMLIDLKKISS